MKGAASYEYRDDRIPGRGPSAAAADDPFDLFDQGRLPAGADLQCLRCPGQAAPRGLPGQGPRGRCVRPAHLARDRSGGPHIDGARQRHRDEPRRGGRPDRNHREVRHRRDVGQAQRSPPVGKHRRTDRADRAVRRRFLLQLHGRGRRRVDHPQGRCPRRGALGVQRRGDLHRRRRARRPAGHLGHTAPQAR